jgi:tetratricopeptide (TPR) repeat protein
LSRKRRRRAREAAERGKGAAWTRRVAWALAGAALAGLAVVKLWPGRAVPRPDLEGLETPLARLIREKYAAVREQPESAARWRELGAVYDANQLYPYAEPCYREALRLEPGDVATLYQLALVIDFQHNETDEPIACLRRVAALNPDYPPVFFHLGRMLERRGDLAGAREALEKTLELDPDLGVAHRSLGQVLLALGEDRAAVSHLERALQLFGQGDGPCYASLAQAHHRLGNEEKAQRCVELSRRSGTVIQLPDPLRYQVTSQAVTSILAFASARERMASGDYGGAIAALRIVVEAKPDHVGAHLELARADRATKQTALAEQELARVLELRASGTVPDSERIDAAIDEYRRGSGE